MLIDINGDGLPDRVFDRNPKTNQTGLFVYLNTGDGFIACIKIDKQPCLVSLWVSVKDSIRQTVAIYVNQHREFAISARKLEKPPNARKRRIFYVD
jgi:hypothetical protein